MAWPALRMPGRREDAQEGWSGRDLAQPAAHIASVTRSRSAVSLVFKIRGLIKDVIATLEARVREAKTTEIELVTSRIVQASAKAAKFKPELSTLQFACWMAG